MIRFKQNVGNGRSLVGDVHADVWDAISSVAEELVVAVKEGLLLEEEEEEEEKEASVEKMGRDVGRESEEEDREIMVESVEESIKFNKKKNQKRTLQRQKPTVYPARPPTGGKFPIYLPTLRCTLYIIKLTKPKNRYDR